MSHDVDNFGGPWRCFLQEPQASALSNLIKHIGRQVARARSVDEGDLTSHLTTDVVKLVREMSGQAPNASISGDHLRWTIYLIANRRAIDLHRNRARSPSLSSVADDVLLDERQDSGVTDPAQLAIRSERISLVREAVASLTSADQALLELHVYQGRSLREIEELLGIPRSTLHRRLLLTYRMLGERLQGLKSQR